MSYFLNWFVDCKNTRFLLQTGRFTMGNKLLEKNEKSFVIPLFSQFSPFLAVPCLQEHPFFPNMPLLSVQSFMSQVYWLHFDWKKNLFFYILQYFVHCYLFKIFLVPDWLTADCEFVINSIANQTSIFTFISPKWCVVLIDGVVDIFKTTI
jgi:hypothetical protein